MRLFWVLAGCNLVSARIDVKSMVASSSAGTRKIPSIRFSQNYGVALISSVGNRMRLLRLIIATILVNVNQNMLDIH